MNEDSFMTDERAHLRMTMERKLFPFLKTFGFANKVEHATYSDAFVFTRNSSYIIFEVLGFHPHDYPWSIDARLGQTGFKRTSPEFDYVYLSYFKHKISPHEQWQREAIKLSFDDDSLNTIDQINKAVDKLIFDLDNFCKDFLTGDLTKFDRIRQIRYLEFLVRTEVFAEHDRELGTRKFQIYQNKEIE